MTPMTSPTAKASSWSCVTSSAVVPLSFRIAAHLLRQAFAQVDVQAGEGLVQQQQARLRRQRARQRHALLLAARQLVRRAPGGVRQAHQVQHLLHALRRARRAAGRRCRRPRCRPRSGAGTARSPGTPCRCGAAPAPGACRLAASDSVSPAIVTRPAAQRSSPATARSSEVLPQPEGPISTPILPGASPSDTASTAARPLLAPGVAHGHRLQTAGTCAR